MNRLALFIAALILISMGCNSNKIDKSLMEFAPQYYSHIASYTSGTISKNTPISIKLRTKIKELPKKVLDFSPNIEGEVSLDKDSQTIIFKPKKALTPGKLYTATFELGKVKDEVSKELQEFKFQFEIIEQDFSHKFYGIKPYSEKQTIKNKLLGTVYTADVMSTAELNKLLNATQNNQKLAIKWTSSADKTVHNYTIEQIKRGTEKSEVILDFEGKNISLGKDLNLKYTVPSINSFEFLSAQVITDDEPYISVLFSDPIASQSMEGLLYFEKGNPKIKDFEIDLNEVKVYLDADRTGTFNLFINEGIRNAKGVKLPSTLKTKLTLADNKPNIELIGDGNIVPHSNKLLFPFYATALKGVHVTIFKVYENNVIQFFQQNDFDGDYMLRQVGRPVFEKDIFLTKKGGIDLNNRNLFSLDLSDFIAPEPGAIYRVRLSIKPHLSNITCMSKKGNTLTEEANEKDEWEDEYYDEYFYPDNYSWEQRDNPCHSSYYTSDRSVVRNVVASNFGIIGKLTNNREIDITVSDLLTTNPLENIAIKVYDYQQQLIGSGNTSSEGFVRLKLKRKPFLIVAEKDKEKGYLKMNGGDALNMSRFDVNGVTSEGGLKAFIYGERGVWRPGDSIHLTGVIQNSLMEIPAHYPVKLMIFNPDNQLYASIINTNGQNGFYSFHIKTPIDAPTGNWRAELKAGGNIFYKTIKIETIKPNKLKINLAFDTDLISKQNNMVKLNSAWLHGAPAANLKANVTANIQPIKTQFKSFENYFFDNPGREFSAEDKVIFDQNLDGEGRGAFPMNLTLGSLPPGMLKVGLFTKVFEKGGEFSTNYEAKTYSPYTNYVGLYINYSFPEWEMIETGKRQQISIATVDQNGNKTSRNSLKVSLYKMSRSWWYSSDDGRNEYISSGYKTLISQSNISTYNGMGKYDINIADDQWGRYMIIVEDEQSGHSAAQIFRADWADWRSRGGMGDDVSTLSFSADKEMYNVGETAEIVIPSSANGRALLSIENGTTILEKRWIETQANQTKISIKLTREMSPNVYANITLIQPHAQTANDLPIRMFGVAPIRVQDPNSHINPVITAPSTIQPQQSFNVSVSEKNGQEMTYTLAIVDEGLLDVTSFKTPDIWMHFNQKEALGVRTWDMYHAVLGAFDGKMANIFAIGGSDDAMKALDKGNMNRFKPVVKFLGPFTLKGKSKTHQINMPNYIGSVKVMVIAGNQNNQFGNAEKDIKVKQPLMLSATLPRVLSPGEEINLPITLFADQGISNARVSITSNDLLIPAQSSFNVSFKGDNETMLYVPVKVNNKTGAATIKITAVSGKYQSFEEVNIPIRLPNPPITISKNESLEANESKSFAFAPFGVVGSNEITLEVATLPNINLGKRLSYLTGYPHGCIEQTTSAVFSQLYLSNLMTFDQKAKEKMEENIKAAITRIRSMQISNGGLGYWPGAVIADDWGSNYAGHFMVVAEQKGFALPVGFKKDWIKYQKTRSDQWNSRASEHGYGAESHQLVQAYRLYTLALAGSPNLGAMNRLREDEQLTSFAAYRLAAAYALAGKKSIATSLITNTRAYQPTYYDYYYTYGSPERDLAMKVETYAIMQEYSAGMPVFERLVAALNQDQWMSTQTTAYSLLAIAQFAGEQKSEGLKFSYEINGKAYSYNSSDKKMTTIKLPLTAGNVKVKNTNGTKLFVSLVNKGTSLNQAIESMDKNLNMTVAYQDMNGNSINPNSLSQGKDFKVLVSVTNPNTIGDYKNLALSQIFPSGWEIINLRLNNQSSSHQGSAATYQDIRDDRVYTYFDLRKNETKSFVILLNAAYKGSYYLPAIKCEAMYDDAIKAIEPNGKATVN